MRCATARRMMSRFLDDELRPGSRAAVDGHLAGCPSCQAALADQRRIWALLSSLPPVEPPDVLRAVERRLAEPAGEPAPLARPGLGLAAWAVAAATLVGLLIWTGIWAGEAHHRASVAGQGELAEAFSDVPPGFEVLALLERSEK